MYIQVVNIIEERDGNKLYKANICVVQYRQLVNPKRNSAVIIGLDILENINPTINPTIKPIIY